MDCAVALGLCKSRGEETRHFTGYLLPVEAAIPNSKKPVLVGRPVPKVETASDRAGVAEWCAIGSWIINNAATRHAWRSISFIEAWFNPRRAHSALRYLLPIDLEREHAA